MKIVKNLKGKEIEYLVRKGNKTVFRGSEKAAEEFINPKPKKKTKTKSKKKSKGK